MTEVMKNGRVSTIPWRKEEKEKKEDMAIWLGAKIRFTCDDTGDNLYNSI
jgi:hypothetical protein